MKNKSNGKTPGNSNEGQFSYDDLSPEELRDHLEQFEPLGEECDQMLKESDERQRLWCIRKAGDKFERMLADKQFACDCLHDSNAGVREVAIYLLTFRMHGLGEIASQCERIAVSDVSPEVRAAAVSALGEFYRGSLDPRIQQLLAQIVSDQRKVVRVLRSAYLALMLVCEGDRPVDIVDVYSRFPSSIDWEFVRTFLPARDI